MLVRCQRGGREEDRERENMELLYYSDTKLTKHLLLKKDNIFKNCGSV
jgi:hypothetical protein